MYLISTVIEQLGTALSVGETGRFECPGCRATERALAITRLTDGSLAYLCHRASCGLKGFVGGARLPQQKIAPPLTKSPHTPFKGVLEPLPIFALDALQDRYGLSPQTLARHDVGWCQEYASVAMPVKHGKLTLGIALRTLDKPKRVRLYKFIEGRELMAWYLGGDLRGCAIVVEDQLSAMKINQLGWNAVALCGTRLGDARICELSLRFHHLGIWLDMDAHTKAVGYVLKYSSVFKYGATLLFTGADPKDCPIPLIRQKIEYERAFYSGCRYGVEGCLATQLSLPQRISAEPAAAIDPERDREVL